MESILSIGTGDYELLIVTGASTDQTNERCAEYAGENPQIKVLRQGGTGLSDARNCGLKEASGTYVAFFDGDDFIDAQAFCRVLTQLKSGLIQADVVVTDYFRRMEGSGQVVPVFQIGEATPLTEGLDFLPQMLTKRQAFWNVWRSIYRRTFLLEHNLFFLENHLCEDVEFTTRMLLTQPQIVFCHEPFYYYRIGRQDSLMARPSYARLRDTVSALKIGVFSMRDSNFPEREAVIRQFQFEYILNLAIVHEVSMEEKRASIQEFSKHREVLRPSSDWMVSFMSRILSCFGVSATGRGLHLLKKYRRRLRA